MKRRSFLRFLGLAPVAAAVAPAAVEAAPPFVGYISGTDILARQDHAADAYAYYMQHAVDVWRNGLIDHIKLIQPHILSWDDGPVIRPIPPREFYIEPSDDGIKSLENYKGVWEAD